MKGSNRYLTRTIRQSRWRTAKRYCSFNIVFRPMARE